MMNSIVTSGRTIEEAVRQGLAILGVTEDQVDVNVLEQPSKGFLGLIGVKAAKVELTLTNITRSESPQRTQTEIRQLEVGDHPNDLVDPYEAAASFVSDVALSMGLEVEVEIVTKRDNTVLNISGSELGLLIGRRGQTLDALQYLVNIIANRHSDSFLRIILDAENFRERRRKTLEQLAMRLASKVIRSGKEMVLEPMSPQERKIIHSRLQDHSEVKTFSKGEEPNRRVVIALKNNK